MILTFESLDRILKSDHSNESYRLVLSCAAVHYAVKRGLTFESLLDMNTKVLPFKGKLLGSPFLW